MKNADKKNAQNRKKSVDKLPGACYNNLRKQKRKGDKKMKKINELKARIRNAEAMMAKFPEDANLREACELRIAESKREIAELKAA